MPPNRYHSSQRCDENANASTKPASSPYANSAVPLKLSIPIKEKTVINIIHLAIDKVNFL
ncbi:hypothetical protein NK638_05230 [Psychrobacter sp. A3]|uniref:hypothetical protein n=1 Tax=Psychrobacter sp. A3 TaxID=2992754 RepID=UPI00237B511F|nr:hypothetical protein [Psychrobacter sp. A3]MDE0490940.1 hypothetical protein [Psychrobacter sp. A3]